MTREEAAAILQRHNKCLATQENGECKYHLIGRCEPCEFFTSDEDFNEAEIVAIEALSAPEILTQDDLRLVRKVLSCVNTLYTVAEPEYKENKIDLLLRKLRAMGIDN